MDIINGIYPDEYIERWGDRFLAERVRETLGVTFERFLKYPESTLIAAREVAAANIKHSLHLAATKARVAIGDFRHLTRKQRRIAGAINQADALSAQLAERSVEGLPRRNGAAVEKLKHHRYPDSHSDFTLQSPARRCVVSRPTPMRQMVADLMSLHLAQLAELIEHEGADISTAEARRLHRLWEGIREDDIDAINRDRTADTPRIGPCEWCGVVDHSLVHGECKRCRAKRHAQAQAANARTRPPIGGGL